MFLRLTFAFAMALAAAFAQQPRNESKDTAVPVSDEDKGWTVILQQLRDRYFPKDFQRTDLHEDKLTDLRPLRDLLFQKYPEHRATAHSGGIPATYFDDYFTINVHSDGRSLSCEVISTLWNSFEKAETELLKLVRTTSAMPRKGPNSRTVGQVTIHYGDSSMKFVSRNVLVRVYCNAPWYRFESGESYAPIAEKAHELANAIDDYIRSYRAPAKQ
jgi:hypothetical protein